MSEEAELMTKTVGLIVLFIITAVGLMLIVGLEPNGAAFWTASTKDMLLAILDVHWILGFILIGIIFGR